MALAIPEISDERLAELAGKIMPVVEDFLGNLRHVVPVDPRTQAYLWAPALTGAADDLEPLAEIRTLHRFSYYGYFKPSVAEVLAQIPEDLIADTVAFQIIERPEDADDLNKELEALNAGFHVAKTRLFKRQ